MAFTSNSELNAKGELIMGAGVAGAFAARFPSLPRMAGRCLQTCNPRERTIYGLTGGILLPSEEGPSSRVWALQTKIRWRDPSPLALVAYSIATLNMCHYSNESWAIAFPGIGRGGLSREAVMPYLETLGDNVSVFEL